MEERKGLSRKAIALIVAAVLLAAGILVVIILVIMASIALPKLSSAVGEARIGVATGDIGAINSALAIYRADHGGRFPEATAPMPVDAIPGFTDYMSDVPQTPWDDDYFYLGNADTYYLYCVTNEGGYIIFDSTTGMIRRDAASPPISPSP